MIMTIESRDELEAMKLSEISTEATQTVDVDVFGIGQQIATGAGLSNIEIIQEYCLPLTDSTSVPTPG